MDQGPNAPLGHDGVVPDYDTPVACPHACGTTAWPWFRRARHSRAQRVSEPRWNLLGIADGNAKLKAVARSVPLRSWAGGSHANGRLQQLGPSCRMHLDNSVNSASSASRPFSHPSLSVARRVRRMSGLTL
jgi:hypothetical protein